MKKYLLKISLFLCLVFPFLSSCTENEESSLNLEQNSSSNYREGYIAVGEPKLVVLKNGLKLFVDQDSTYYFEDVVYSKTFIDSINKVNVSTRSSAIKNYINYWPSEKIPYEIASGFSNDDIIEIQRAFDILSNNSALQFVKATSNDKHKIIINTTNNGIYSDYIGMNPKGYNNIYLEKLNGFSEFSYGNIMHEIMHCLGFTHEQNRSDRDNYIDVYWDNIYDDANSRYQFEKNDPNNYYNIGNIDYGSIMMYGSMADSKNGNYTMLKKNGESWSEQRENLSSTDIEGLNLLYGPKISLESTLEDGSRDDSPSDHDDTYTNCLYFLTKNGEKTTLQYPRLVVLESITEEQSYNGETPNELINISYVIVPAGATSYSLGESYDEESSGQEGIERRYYTGYSILN